MTLFIDNKYTRWYFDIIQNAQNRATTRKKAKEILGYVESHHIIPKSLGGPDDSENKAHLTAREHFICHRLLTKMTCGINKAKMSKAVHKMCSSNRFQQRIKIKSRTYDFIRREHAAACAATAVPLKGAANGMYGKNHTEESKKIMSENRTGVSPGRHTDEQRRKQSERQKGVPKSEKHKVAIKESWERTRDQRIGENHPSYGLKRSDETKAKMRAAWAKRKEQKINT